MGMFAFYFVICFLALIVRGYYRVPDSCIVRKYIDKEDDKWQSIIADRLECKCHYTKFLWRFKSYEFTNDTSFNSSNTIKFSLKRRVEPIALVSK